MEVGLLPLECLGTWKPSRDGDFSMAHVPYIEDFAHRSAPSLFLSHREYVRTNMACADLVEKAVESGRKALGSFLPAFMYTTKAGHSDIGLVFYINDLKEEDFDKESNKHYFGGDRGIVARVSIGPGKRKEDKCGWNPLDIGRFHISVYGFRDFFPLEGEVPELPLKQKSDCLREEVHFSLRWFKKEDGGWDYYNPYPKGTASTQCPWMRLSKAVTMTKVPVVPRKNHIPFTDELDEYGQAPYDKTSEEDRFKVFETSHSGYKPVLDLLSKFSSDVSNAKQISELSPEEGINYLFQQVTPALKAFIDSN